ncbi:MAG: V-type ATP synthase subunit B [Gammaproteobacteria bacterium]|nr:V-type ATP synthase subunit B [Gammaproteobacteria bacterium]MDH5800687.1 V-type ATP synthase subunit B [Gammaproteobacteria bacterium]
MKSEVYSSNTVEKIDGPLLFLKRTVDAGLNDAVEVIGDDGHRRLGRVASLDHEHLIIEVLESTTGLSLHNIRVRFEGEPLHFNIGPDILGRVLDGVGRPLDQGPPISAQQRLRIDGLPINPVARRKPTDFIETGISSIDLLNSLVRGQKLPIFSASGLPHDRMATQIAQYARLRGEAAGRFAVIFTAIGVSHDVSDQFRKSMENSGALERTVLFLNLASDSSTQRLLAPRYALTAAEYLAYSLDMHVLVIMTDMTNYCEALREVSSSHGEVPGRKGYPGYMYSDLAAIFERAGCIKGISGTLTQLPILTMPADDITHPIPDLSGYITEGQIVLDRELDRRNVFPPVKVLPSLSRLMKDGTGKGFTHADHGALANQLYASFARSVHVRLLASVMGEEGLSDTDRLYLAFGEQFEMEFIKQEQARSLEQSMDLGWRLLQTIPITELTRLSDSQIDRYIRGREAQHATTG